MAQTLIVQLAGTLKVNGVQDVVLSTIEPDTEGNFVREFSFFGTTDDPASTEQPLVLTIRAVSTTRAALEITTPALQV